MQRGVRLGVTTLHPSKPLEREQGLCLLVHEALLPRDLHGARELFAGPREIALLHQRVGGDASDRGPKRR